MITFFWHDVVRSLRVRIAQTSERRAELVREQLGMLPHREVAAAIDLMEIREVGEGAAGPRFLSANDLIREYRDRHRDGDLARLLC